MKILMMGTGPFAVPTFEALVASEHEVCGLITRPPAGSHRRKRKGVNPMRDSAERLEVEVYDPQSVNDSQFAPQLSAFDADLFVVCDYGQILSTEVLSLSRLGGINLHGSLLPQYRGAAPINWAIFNGDSTTGNTVILMTPRLDGGPILETVEIKIEADDTAISIEEKLSQLGPESVLRCIKKLESWDGSSSIGSPQDPALVTKAPRLKKSDGQIDWQRSAGEIFNQVRAFQPWPGSYSNLIRQAAESRQAAQRLILTKVSPLAGDDSESLVPGTVAFVSPDKLIIQTGQGQLDILQLQPAGKKNMPVADFLRGNQVQEGDRLVAE